MTLHAQSMPDNPGAAASDAPQLETINVTARRSIEQRFFAAGSMVVVDRKDIEQLGAFSVADVLRALPGVQVTPTADGSVEIRMRGMDRGATQLLIDGQRVASAKSQLPMDQLPSELIERIEVVRAPSAEFSGATGGTINIVLRQATVQRETNIRLTDNHVWGSDAAQAFFSRSGPIGSKPADADASLASQPWAYFVAASSIGYILGADTHRTSSDPSGVTSEVDASGRYRRRDDTLIPRISGHVGASDQLTLRANLSQADFSGNYRSVGSGHDSLGSYALQSGEAHRYDRRYLQGAIDWTHRFEGAKLETTLSDSNARDTVDRLGDVRQDYGFGPVNSVYGLLDKRDETYGSLSTKLTGTKSPLLWSVGALVDRRSLSVNSLSNVSRAPDTVLDLGARITRQVLWGQNEWELPGNTTLTAGLRGEESHIESSDATLLTDQRQRWLQPSLHVRTPLGEDTQMRVNLARITRNPSIWDLIDRRIPSQGSNSITNPDVVGNPFLQPETSWTLDTGMDTKLGSQGMGGLNLFVRQVSDAIATTTALVGNRWVDQRQNVGDALVWGLEADVKSGLTWLGLADDWTLAANASLLQSRMTSGINVGQRIPGQARYLATINVARPIRNTGGLFGGGTLTLTGPADFNTSPGITGRDKARAMLDLYVGSVITKLGYWRIGVYNIGNVHFVREKSYADPQAGLTQTTSDMTLTPRLYVTIGTRF
ncbi:TonB-dependent receptor [Variovorax sp. J22R133]|uniref:TonB-dependent receptor plug domain-containing protein n=1 Tax=Variovorax brevis TaxID=3053503 RepID=UPI002577375F|nr:TonB-dependent receptor [Variovorax sp. J22R133]MDM0113006.1 TonB-dependent receptor [Variovorax sp. J22R133]